jgi:hypothetical protein
MQAIGVLLVSALFVGACGSGESAVGLNDELRYVRTGGLAGLHDELIVDPNGDARLTVRGHNAVDFSLDEQEIDSLASALDGADLAGLESDLAGERSAPDAFRYVVNYQGAVVRTDDPSVPDDLKPVLAALDRIVEEHRPR